LLEVDTDFSALEVLGYISLCLGDKVFVPLQIECHAFYFMKLEGSCSGVHKPQVNKFCKVFFSIIFGEFSLHSSHVKNVYQFTMSRKYHITGHITLK